MKTITSILILSSLMIFGCGKSIEVKNAESVAEQQDAVIYSRKHEGNYEVYAELNDKDRRWKESNMRQTSTCVNKNKDSAYACLSEKMYQGSWVWRLVPEVCSECNGKGVVVYDKDNFFVVNGLAEVDIEYTCSICGGSGEVFREVRENE